MGKTRPEKRLRVSADAFRNVAPALTSPTTATALTVMDILTFRWFDDALSIEANRILPPLLINIYAAAQRGRTISKRQACEPLRIDPTNTGARYIAMAAELGLLTISSAKSDARKDSLELTPQAISLIENDLLKIKLKQDHKLTDAPWHQHQATVISPEALAQNAAEHWAAAPPPRTHSDQVNRIADLLNPNLEAINDEWRTAPPTKTTSPKVA